MDTNGNGKVKGKVTPHHRMTLQDVIRDYQDGLITAKGAIFYGVSASQAPGKPMHLHPTSVATQLGLHVKTVYKKIAELRLQRRLDFEVDGSLIVKIPLNEKTGLPIYFPSSELSSIDSPMESIDSPMESIDSPMESKGDKKPPELPLCGNFGSSQLYSYTTNTTRSSLSSKAERERGKDEQFWKGEEPYREWLIKKAESLPKFPTFLEQWLQSQALKESNLIEFEQYQKALERVKVPPTPPELQNLSLELQTAIAEGDSTRAYEIARSSGLLVGDITSLLGGRHA